MAEGLQVALEDDFHHLHDHATTSVLAEVLFYMPGGHVCRSAVSKQTFRTNASLTRDRPTFTLLEAEFLRKGNSCWLLTTETSRCFPHEPLTIESFQQSIEACSGIAAVSTGYEAIGISTKVFIDQNEKFCDWLKAKHGASKTVLCGDAGSTEVIAATAAAIQKPSILSAGIACQPYSFLGDRKEGHDKRSESLPAVLKLGFFLRAPLILLECTRGAMESAYVQNTLKDFTKKTGFNLFQDILHLHHTWTSQRTRWWAALSLPNLNLSGFPQMPKLFEDPQISLLMQIQRILPSHDMQQLVLDQRETMLFHQQPKGISGSLLNENAVMPTATHSWGSQLVACECGCRKAGFSADRLQSKGLYGCLVSLGNVLFHDDKVYQATRHPDPREMAILMGISPSFLQTEEKFHLRFLMAAVGQSASPFQGAWVLGNALSGLNILADHRLFSDPLEAIGHMGLCLMDERFHCWTNQEHTFKTKVLQDQFRKFTKVLPDSMYIAADRVQVTDPSPPCTKLAPCTDTPTGRATQLSDVPVTQTRAADLFEDSSHACPVDDFFTQTNAADLFADSIGNASDTLTSVHSVHSESEPIATHRTHAMPRPSVAPHIACKHDVQGLHETSTTQVYSNNGALLMFANKRKLEEAVSADNAAATNAASKHPKIAEAVPDESADVPPAQAFSPGEPSEPDEISIHTEHDISPTQEWTQPAIDPDLLTDDHSLEFNPPTGSTAKERSDENMHIPKEEDKSIHQNKELTPLQALLQRRHVFIGLDKHLLQRVELTSPSTWGQIVSAEQTLQGISGFLKPVSVVGSDLPYYAEPEDGDMAILHPVGVDPLPCPKRGHDRQPELTGLTRLEALWNQQGWVAVDEMTYYLQWFNNADHPTTDPIVLKNLPDDPIRFGSWILTAFEKACEVDHPFHMGTCILHEEHWVPLHIQVSTTSNTMTLCTTPEASTFIQQLLQDAFGEIDHQLMTQPILSQFPADCGFQSLAFVIGLGNGMTSPHAIQPTEAIQWRRMFASFLCSSDKHADIVLSIRLGGMPEVSTHRDLVNLLESHGVFTSRSSALATQLISAIGTPSIQATLSSNRSWRDLKSKASACRPAIQLIMDDELQVQIENRRAAGKPFGRKQSKAKTTQRAQIPQQIHLKANQIQIPSGIFKQEDGTPVNQISLQQLRQKTAGIAVLNKDDAEPFLQLREPLSGEGVGMLIVDYKDLQLPMNHTIMTFPASFAETNDPMIVSAALVQLGAKTITRLMPSNPVSIEQVDTQVVRCVLFRDQYEGDWTQVTQRPFNTIRNMDCMREIEQADILDCFDRQFLNKQYQKSKPDTAEIYSITCRFRLPAAQKVLAANAQSGLFTEPRAQHGREPCTQYKVVWLPKKTFSEALVAQQVTEVSTSIARAGDRYGLRVATAMAKQVHEQHRPGITYLDTSSVQQYQISPLPFGTTKQSLQKVCDAWGWSARPSHTLGLTSDKSGLIWVVSASQPPQYLIWTMTHGDVLITELPQKNVLPPLKAQPLIASQKTLKHLLDAQNSVSKADASDPWLKKDQDPWMPASHAVTGAAITNSQLAKIEASLERKIRSTLQDQKAASSKAPDEAMDPNADMRTQKLEQQVTQLQDSFSGLTTSVNSFQQQQTAVNQQMNQQVQQIKTHLDNQTQSVQGMLDSKLEEQMNRIERLLSMPEKRAKTHNSNEWPPVSCTTMHARWSNQAIRCLLLAFIIIRIGEASNPGPPFSSSDDLPRLPGLTLGALNPTGIIRKSSNILDLPCREHAIWGICETHLTSPGIAKFKAELGSHKTALRFYPGAPAPHRSSASTSIGGTHTGTAFVTDLPTRRLQPMWSHDEWFSARFCMHSFLHNQVWIQGAVIYGHAFRAATTQVKEDTDRLLALATSRIVLNATGCRFIMGDFNQESDLPQVQLWRERGWKEVQEIFHSQTGREIAHTCKGKTRKDFIWISPELQPFLSQVDVVPHQFPDHAALCAHFVPFGTQTYQYHWRRPKPVDWANIPKLSSDSFQLDFQQAPEDICKAIAVAFEDRIHDAMTAKQHNMHPSQKGRCQTMFPAKTHVHTKPLKPSRHGAVQPLFPGHNLGHQRWFTQLRRLESLSKLLSKQPDWSISQSIHAAREWRAVLTAPGFPDGFPSWWSKTQHKYFPSPEVLPHDLPTLAQLGGIMQTLSREVRHMEQTLMGELQAKAKNSRISNPNRVFRDFAKPAVQPVQLLDYSITGQVIQIDHEDHALILDKPCDFKEGTILGPNGPISPIMTCHDTVWVRPDDMIPIGATLHQPNQIGKLEDVFDAFGQEWVKRWDKHRHLPDDFWAPMMDFIDIAIPQQPQMDLPKITYDIWIAALKKKRKKAATGPDGLSREDLLHVPRDITEQLLVFLHKIELGESTWPSQWTTGIVHCLEKTEQASKAGDYRPITIFSLVFRVWSSIRSTQLLQHVRDLVPTGCCGNVPSKSAVDVWYNLQLSIEESFESEVPLCGIVCDIQKCFNNLPREPLLKVLLKVGVAPQVLRSWSNALVHIQRRFAVRGSIGPAHKSTSGFAEGDSLSVVAMVGANYLLDRYLQLSSPSVKLWSYVDNLELSAHGTQDLLSAFQALDRILQALQLPLDMPKTYAWGTESSFRKDLLQGGFTVVHSCRDLGGQMQYTRKATNHVIVDRIATFKPRWKSLAISAAPYKQKLLALRSVAWSHILHGAGSAVIGPAHFDSLRTEAVRSLGEHKPGVSPSIHLSLLEHPAFDPAFFALISTVRMARQHMRPDLCIPAITLASQLPRRTKARVGPCNVLLFKLRDLGWEWHTEGYFVSLQGRPVDLWQMPFQELKATLTRDWQQHIATANSTRKTMQGLPDMHPGFTVEALPTDHTDRALLRRSLNGTFFTADHLAHRHEDEDGLCKLCHQPDSITHRMWHCPAFTSVRAEFSCTDLQAIFDSAPATHNHGWFPTPPECQRFWDEFLISPPDPLRVPFSCDDEETLLHLFTDGSCLQPQDKFARLCSWGVAVATSRQMSTFQAAASGILMGSLQTIVRAELQAVHEALRLAFTQGIPFWLWVDNQLVYRQLTYMYRFPYTQWGGRTCNHDLLNQIAVLLGTLHHLCHGIQKVCSHQDATQAQDEAEEWSFQGNDFADKLAANAVFSFPSLMTNWSAMVHALQRQRQLRQVSRSLIVKIGHESLRLHHQAASTDPTHIPAAPLPTEPMMPWIFPAHDVPWRFAIPGIEQFSQWVASLHVDTGQVRRWSWWELYIDAQLQVPNLSPVYEVQTHRWKAYSSSHAAPFLKRCRSFSKFITQYAKHLEFQLPSKLAVPASVHMSLWTNTLPVTATDTRQRLVDEWLGQFVTGISRTKDLRSVPWSLCFSFSWGGAISCTSQGVVGESAAAVSSTSPKSPKSLEICFETTAQLLYTLQFCIGLSLYAFLGHAWLFFLDVEPRKWVSRHQSWDRTNTKRSQSEKQTYLFRFTAFHPTMCLNINIHAFYIFASLSCFIFHRLHRQINLWKNWATNIFSATCWMPFINCSANPQRSSPPWRTTATNTVAWRMQPGGCMPCNGPAEVRALSPGLKGLKGGVELCSHDFVELNFWVMI